MQNLEETKQISVIFVYSDELRAHEYGIMFDNNKPAPSISNADYDKVQNLEVKNTEKTNVKLVAQPSSADPLMEFAETDFSFKEGQTYYLQIIPGAYRDKINITDYNPTTAAQEQDTTKVILN